MNLVRSLSVLGGGAVVLALWSAVRPPRAVELIPARSLESSSDLEVRRAPPPSHALARQEVGAGPGAHGGVSGRVLTGCGEAPTALHDGDGALVFHVLGERDQRLTVPVAGGRFRLDADEVRAGVTLVLDGVKLDGHPFTPVGASAFSSSDPEWTVRALRHRSASISVRDAITGSELAHAELRCLPAGRLPSRQGPGRPRSADGPSYPPVSALREEALLSSGTSPLRAELPREACAYWVGSPGYAWRSWSPADASDEQLASTVRLELGAELRVRVDGWPNLADLELEVEPTDPAVGGASLHATPLPSERVWSGLPASEHRVSLRSGAALLARETVRLTGGETSELTLSRDQLSARVRIVCRGAGGRDAPLPQRLFLERCAEGSGSLERVREWSSVELLRGEAGSEEVGSTPEFSAPTGRYLVSAAPSSACALVDLAPGTREVELVLRPVESFEVLLIDVATEGGVDPDWVAAAARPTGPGAEEATLRLSSAAVRQRGPGSLFHLDLPPGDAWLVVKAEGYGVTHHELSLADPGRPAVVFLERYSTLELRSEDPRWFRFLAGDWTSDLIVVDEGGEPCRVMGRSKRQVSGDRPSAAVTLLVDHVGACEVRLPADAAPGTGAPLRVTLAPDRPVTIALDGE